MPHKTSKKAPQSLMVPWIERHYLWLLALIISFSIVTRFYRLAQPKHYIFDEVYHAVTAKLIARNDPRAYEWWNPPVEPNTAVDWLHPPYAKYTQAFFISLLGENTLGWRFSSAVFGVLVIVAVFKLADEVFENKTIALLSAWLASLDGLLLVQSRIAMNDIHVTFWILISLTLYWKYLKVVNHKNSDLKQAFSLLIATGVGAGLAMGTKWSGLFVLLAIGSWEVGRRLYSGFSLNHATPALRKWFNHQLLSLPMLFFCLVIVPITLYLLSYSHMFIQGKDWSHFKELHNQIFWYQTHLEATHGFQSRPAQWFFDLRPVWYDVNYVDSKTISNIYAQGNPILFWVGDVAVVMSAVCLAALLIFKRPQLPAFFSKLPWLKIGFILYSYLFVWSWWQFSPRIMFFYHYTPAVPLLCILVASWLYYLPELRVLPLKHSRALAAFLITLIAITFVVWYPNWTGLPVPTAFANKVYFAIPSWK